MEDWQLCRSLAKVQVIGAQEVGAYSGAAAAVLCAVSAIVE